MSRSSKAAVTLDARVEAVTRRAQLLAELAGSEQVAELATRHTRAVESSRRAAGAVRRAEVERARATTELADVRVALRQQVTEWRERGVSLADLGAALGMDPSALRTLVGERQAPGAGRKRGRGRAQRLPLAEPVAVDAEVVGGEADGGVHEDGEVIDAEVVDATTVSTPEPAWG